VHFQVHLRRLDSHLLERQIVDKPVVFLRQCGEFVHRSFEDLLIDSMFRVADALERLTKIARDGVHSAERFQFCQFRFVRLDLPP
jgi:hypothetical protein